MDQRDLSRINMKFGKFLDPFLIIIIVLLLSVSILSLKSLSPRTFSGEDYVNILGAQDPSPATLNLIGGEHNYITNENIEEVTSTHIKYTTLVKKPPKGRISKPILKIENLTEEAFLKVQLVYTNSNNSKISLFNEENNVSYILQENNIYYTHNIELGYNTDIFYLAIENTKPVFFDQYIEINFFLNL